jgi:hypothetical protein
MMDWLGFRHMEKLLTFFSIFRLNLFLMAAASVAQAGTKQGEWTSPLPVADSLLPGAGDSADDGGAAGDAGGAVLRLQP